jgi:hypothetical protein
MTMSDGAELLGVVVWSDEPDALWMQYRSLGLRRGGPLLTILPSSPPERPAGTVAPCWLVADLGRAVNEWESQGARIIGAVDLPPHSFQLARDREGGLALMAEHPRAPRHALPRR